MIIKLSYKIRHIHRNTTMETKLLTGLEIFLLNFISGDREKVPVRVPVNRCDSCSYNRLRN